MYKVNKTSIIRGGKGRGGHKGGACSICSFHSHSHQSHHPSQSHVARSHRTTSLFARSLSSTRSFALSILSFSQRHSSPPTSHHPQSHSEFWKCHFAQILPFDLLKKKKGKTKKVDKKGTPTVSSAHAKEIAVLWWQSINAWGRGQLTVTSATQCCQTGASSQESGRDVNCRRDFWWRLFFRRNLTAKNLNFKSKQVCSVSTRFFSMQDWALMKTNAKMWFDVNLLMHFFLRNHNYTIHAFQNPVEMTTKERT